MTFNLVLTYSKLNLKFLKFVPAHSISTSTLHRRKSVFNEMLSGEQDRMTMEEAVGEVEFRSDINVEGLSERRDAAEQDILKQTRMLSYKNVERKHFRPPRELCLLTYGMKETLRNLHNVDPVRWNAEELSRAFPISPAGVKKLVRYRSWPKSELEIQQHDAIILENWKKATNGNIGNLQILKKLVEKKFDKDCQSSLPVATMGTQEEVLRYINDLKFTSEDDLFLSQDDDRQKQLKKFKKTYPFKGTFKDIITNYESKVNEVNGIVPTESKETEMSFPRCRNLDEVLSSISEPYSSLTKVTVRCLPNKDLQSMSVKGRKFSNKKIITYDQFIKRKKSKMEKSSS